MAKPLNEIGGWLKFFRIWIPWSRAVGIVTVAAVYGVYFMILVSFKLFGFVWLFSLILVISIIVVLEKLHNSLVELAKQKNPIAPRTIVSKLCRIVLSQLLITIVGFFPFLLARHSEGLPVTLRSESWRHGITLLSMHMGSIVGLLLLNSIWIVYFFRSKRVAAYYGANATKLSL